MSEDTKQIGIRIPVSMYHELKQIAHTRDLSLTEIAIEAFIQYLDASTPGLCPSCHTQNPPDAFYCNSCGMPLIKEIRDRLILEATTKVNEDPVFSEYIKEQKIKLRKLEEAIERMQEQIDKTKTG